MQDLLIAGMGGDVLCGGKALDVYYFERPDRGRETIREVLPRNVLRLPDSGGFAGA